MPTAKPGYTRAYIENIADDQLIDANVVAALTGTSLSTINRWEADAVLPRGIRLAGSRRWRAGVIRQFIAKLEVEAMAVQS